MGAYRREVGKGLLPHIIDLYSQSRRRAVALLLVNMPLGKWPMRRLRGEKFDL